MIRLPRTISILPALILAGAVGTAAHAQTPTTTIENARGDVVLESYDGGALLAPYYDSAFSTGAIPAEGSGVRMMWYPGAAAFRAGRVQSDQWNDGNIGSESVAFGENTTASGDRSTAMGSQTTASGNNSTAMGEGTTASGDQSTAMGFKTTASAAQSTAMGNYTTASGNSSTAMGDQTTASGSHSIAMGDESTADGEESLAAGNRTAAESDNSFVWNDGSEYHAIPNSSNDGLSSSKAVNGEPVTGPETFSVGAQGGVRFITGPNSATYIDGGSTGWATTSTRSAKTDVTRADPTAVLEAVEAMPISTWEYKTESGEGAGTRHIGPMAEDFHGALPYDLGSSEDHINSLNADGVALGAVKGLARKVNRQKETIAALKAENRDIRAENQDIKKRLAALEADRSSALPAGLSGSWGLALLLGLGGLAAGLLWRRR